MKQDKKPSNQKVVPEDERTVVDEILSTCEGSTTELARRLTKHTGNYYSPQMVNYWRQTGKIPPNHMTAVSAVSGMPVERIAPEFFEAYHRNAKGL